MFNGLDDTSLCLYNDTKDYLKGRRDSGSYAIKWHGKYK